MIRQGRDNSFCISVCVKSSNLAKAQELKVSYMPGGKTLWGATTGDFAENLSMEPLDIGIFSPTVNSHPDSCTSAVETWEAKSQKKWFRHCDFRDRRHIERVLDVQLKARRLIRIVKLFSLSH